MKYDLAFGNSVCVRKAFINNYHGDMIVFTGEGLSKLDYPDRDGDRELIEITRKVIARQLGRDYKHILLTNGATGGVVIALRAFFQRGFSRCFTRKAPWYLRYPSMIDASGLYQVPDDKCVFPDTSVLLMDLPSNPLALTNKPVNMDNVIIDGVYLNNVYSNGLVDIPKHRVMVGSYSKLTGMNGIRMGWIATDDDALYEEMKKLTIGEYCGLDVPGAEILKNVLTLFNWDMFECTARIYLDNNREQAYKLEKYMGGFEVPSIGMFYYGAMDKKCQELMSKAGIEWTKGSSLGTSDDFGRLNLGQDRDVVKNAVKAFLKADRISRK